MAFASNTASSASAGLSAAASGSGCCWWRWGLSGGGGSGVPEHFLSEGLELLLLLLHGRQLAVQLVQARTGRVGGGSGGGGGGSLLLLRLGGRGWAVLVLASFLALT
ncbi:MAG: hypothetical protein AAFR01_13655, partial [Pseudomonadota bacterium]